MASAEEGTGANEGAGGKILGELRAICCIELVVKREIGAEDLNENEVVHTHASGRKGSCVVLEEIFDFVIDFVRGLAGLGIEADASREIKRVSSKDRFAER